MSSLVISENRIRIRNQEAIVFLVLCECKILIKKTLTFYKILPACIENSITICIMIFDLTKAYF